MPVFIRLKPEVEQLLEQACKRARRTRNALIHDAYRNSTLSIERGALPSVSVFLRQLADRIGGAKLCGMTLRRRRVSAAGGTGGYSPPPSRRPWFPSSLRLE